MLFIPSFLSTSNKTTICPPNLIYAILTTLQYVQPSVTYVSEQGTIENIENKVQMKQV